MENNDITNCKVLVEKSAINLEASINKLLEEGYEFQGSVAISMVTDNRNTYNTFVQVMVKRD